MWRTLLMRPSQQSVSEGTSLSNSSLTSLKKFTKIAQVAVLATTAFLLMSSTNSEESSKATSHIAESTQK